MHLSEERGFLKLAGQCLIPLCALTLTFRAMATTSLAPLATSFWATTATTASSALASAIVEAAPLPVGPRVPQGAGDKEADAHAGRLPSPDAVRRRGRVPRVVGPARTVAHVAVAAAPLAEVALKALQRDALPRIRPLALEAGAPEVGGAGAPWRCPGASTARTGAPRVAPAVARAGGPPRRGTAPRHAPTEAPARLAVPCRRARRGETATRVRVRVEVAGRVGHRSARAFRTPLPSPLGRRVAYATQVPNANVERTAAVTRATGPSASLAAAAPVGARAGEAHGVATAETKGSHADTGCRRAP